MKPILFNTEMVKAILEGRKTVTRRICKEIAGNDFRWGLDKGPYIGDHRVFAKMADGWKHTTLKNQWLYDMQTAVDGSRTYMLKPPYKVGDILYVRETWFKNYPHKYGEYQYRADGEEVTITNIYGEIIKVGKAEGLKWKPSIHMPKEAARIFLRVTNVKVERLQEITEEDAVAEGIDWLDEACYENNGWHPTYYDPDSGGRPVFRDGFIKLWDSLNAKRGYGWETNPWVWVIEFEREEVEK